METLFDNADINEPAEASKLILINMLSEITESVGRFSPWYKKPASAFGLIRAECTASHDIQWTLSPQAITQWKETLDNLSLSIERNTGLIVSVNLLNSIDDNSFSDSCLVRARCLCMPPHYILVKRSILIEQGIVCDICQSRYFTID